MPRTTKTTVQQDDEGYFTTAIPKALGDGLDLEDGTQVSWKIDSGNALRMVKDE